MHARDVIAFREVPAIDQITRESQRSNASVVNVNEADNIRKLRIKLQREVGNQGLNRLLRHSEIQAFGNGHKFDSTTDGIFSIYGSFKNRSDDEGFAFLTERGYGTPIVDFEVLDEKWKRVVLYEGNNAIEKLFHQLFDSLSKVSRKLWKVAGAGGVSNKRSKSIAYPYVIGMLHRVEGLQEGVVIQL
ncbi:hypothetical protein HK100_011087 [Physocladia obscura]|uniref:Uncharacterized protein n=1 Tax=Physocladia obscura TaxID=109957 RepID=A0AAD5T1P8_9FUNG|nr:hypothetical protein HK100_011087 [Physocladia obscura]